MISPAEMEIFADIWSFQTVSWTKAIPWAGAVNMSFHLNLYSW
jgi:hypothetical protein